MDKRIADAAAVGLFFIAVCVFMASIVLGVWGLVWFGHVMGTVVPWPPGFAEGFSSCKM